MEPNVTQDFRSKLGKVRGLGPAHEGVGHWWLQRVTALALLPLSLWFVYALVTQMLSPDVVQVAEWLASPVNALIMVLLLLAMSIHAKLGLQVVIEDYVHAPAAKYTLLLLVTFLAVTLGAVGVVSVLKLHLLDVAAVSEQP